MKNTINVPLVRLFGIIAFVAVMGFSFIACDDGGGGGHNGGNTAHTHDWGEWVQTTAPTGCTTAGEETRVCKLDATHKETQPIAAPGHDYEWEETTAPTNITEGIETGTCKRDPSHTDTRATPSTLITTTAEWDAALSQISEKTGGEYTLNIGAEIEVAGPFFPDYSFGTTTLGNSLIVTLKGSGKLRLNNESVLINVNERQILIIDSETLTLQGRTDSIASVIAVYANGTLELRNGTISGNTLSDSAVSYISGGVEVWGTFTMSGGKISGNSGRGGGGVYVGRGGTFTMSGGEISGNTASNGGGGVYSNAGTLTMSGGKISGNSASGEDSRGGGVFVGGPFIMRGGEISGNSASTYGGGVYVDSGSFRIVTGTIYGSDADENLRNTAPTNGAAFFMMGGITAERGTFTGEEWNKAEGGNLVITNNTIKVKDGLIVP